MSEAPTDRESVEQLIALYSRQHGNPTGGEKHETAETLRALLSERDDLAREVEAYEEMKQASKASGGPSVLRQAMDLRRYKIRAEAAEAERDAAMEEALSLAKTLHANHYSDIPQWGAFDYLAGVISQIDNMVAGIIIKSEAERYALRASNERWRSMWEKEQTHNEELDAQLDGVKIAGQDLLSRLSGWKADHLNDENFRDYDGHVDPCESRLRAALINKETDNE